MGKSQSKEDTIIVQNAVGDGNNAAKVQDFVEHISTNNILMMIIVVVLLCGVAVIVYKHYKRCHMDWIRREANEIVLRHTGYRFSGRRPNVENV